MNRFAKGEQVARNHCPNILTGHLSDIDTVDNLLGDAMRDVFYAVVGGRALAPANRDFPLDFWVFVKQSMVFMECCGIAQRY